MKLLLTLVFIALLSPLTYADSRGPCYHVAEGRAKYQFELLLDNVRREPDDDYWGRYRACLDKELKYEKTTAGAGGRGIYYVYWFKPECDWSFSLAMYPDCSIYGE